MGKGDFPMERRVQSVRERPESSKVVLKHKREMMGQTKTWPGE